MSPIDPYLGAQAPTQDFIRTFLDREIPAGLLFYAPFLPQTGNQAWAADKRIVVPIVETVDADGSYFASDGLIRRARANALRMEGLGALIEGTRTNLCLRSAELDVQPPWAGGGITPNAIAGPDGELSGDRFQGVSCTQNITVVPGTQYTFSWYARDNGSISVRHSVRDNTGGANIGPITEYLPLLSTTEWRRITRQFTAPGGCVSVSIWPARASNADVYFWGVQLEQSSVFIGVASSYIPTVAASVARAADALQYAAANYIEAAQGTIFFALTSTAHSRWGYYVNAVVLDTRVAGLADGLLVQYDAAADRLSYLVRSGGATVATLNSLAELVQATTYIVACVWNTNDFRLYFDGVLQASDVVGATPAAHDASISIGHDRALANPSFGNISHLTIFNRAMSAPEIEQRSRFLHNQMARAS